MTRASLIAALTLALAASARAQAPAGELAFSLSLAPGLDTNARRTVGQAAESDAFLSASARASGRTDFGGRQRLSGGLDLGARKYLALSDEDLAVAQGGAGYAWRGASVAMGVEAAGKLRLSRAGARDYGDLAGLGFVDMPLASSTSLRVTAGGRGFAYAPNDAYSSAGPQAGLALRFNASRRIALSAGGSAALPYYRGQARLEGDGAPSDARRRDTQVLAHATAHYRGPIAAQAGYLFAQVDSNSFGESLRRHRFFAAATARLPARLFLTGYGALQLIRYPDGIFLSSDLLLEDEESQSSLSAKLARPVGERTEVELRYALHWIGLPGGPTGPLDYLRQVASLGVSMRW